MPDFTLTVTIECDTIEQAQQVAAERLGHDEDYGFEYTIGYGEITAPRCGVPCSHGGSCTLPINHDGDHEAHAGPEGKLMCSWPQRSALNTTTKEA